MYPYQYKGGGINSYQARVPEFQIGVGVYLQGCQSSKVSNRRGFNMSKIRVSGYGGSSILNDEASPAYVCYI